MIVTYDQHSIFYIVQASLTVITYNHHSIFLAQASLTIATYSHNSFLYSTIVFL